MSGNSSKDELVSSLNSLGIEVVAGKVRRSDIKKALAGTSVKWYSTAALIRRLPR